MRKVLLVVLLVSPVALSGCLLAGGAVGFGVLYSMADKGVKYRYDAPLDSVRTSIDAFCRDEAIEVVTSEDHDQSSLRKGVTTDSRRVRIEAMRWDDATTIVFISVGVSGDTYASGQLHDRFSERMHRDGR